MQQVLSLEINLCSPKMLCESTRKEQRCRPPGVLLEQALKLVAELFVAPCLFVFEFQLFQRSHQGLRNIAAAVRAKPSRGWFCLYCSGRHYFSALLTAATNAFNFSGSFRPGSRSTPLTTSTPQGCSAPMASLTFSGFNPPATINRP